MCPLPHIAEGNREGKWKNSSQSSHRHREITWNGEYVSCTTLITREIPLHLTLSWMGPTRIKAFLFKDSTAFCFLTNQPKKKKNVDNKLDAETMAILGWSIYLILLSRPNWVQSWDDKDCRARISPIDNG